MKKISVRMLPVKIVENAPMIEVRCSQCHEVLQVGSTIVLGVVDSEIDGHLVDPDTICCGQKPTYPARLFVSLDEANKFIASLPYDNSYDKLVRRDMSDLEKLLASAEVGVAAVQVLVQQNHLKELKSN